MDQSTTFNFSFSDREPAEPIEIMVDITQDDIITGRPCDSDNCAVALAVTRALEEHPKFRNKKWEASAVGANHVSADISACRIGPDPNGLEILGFLHFKTDPETAARIASFVKRYDHHENVDPMHFKMQVLTQAGDC